MSRDRVGVAKEVTSTSSTRTPAESNFYSSTKPGPGDLLLLVEVSDTTASYDLGRKAQLYSRHGVAEYWVVDQAAGCAHVFSSPSAEGFASDVAAGPGTVLIPRLLPTVEVEVSLLFGDCRA